MNIYEVLTDGSIGIQIIRKEDLKFGAKVAISWDNGFTRATVDREESPSGLTWARADNRDWVYFLKFDRRWFCCGAGNLTAIRKLNVSLDTVVGPRLAFNEWPKEDVTVVESVLGRSAGKAQ